MPTSPSIHNEQQLVDRLNAHDVKPTAMRLLVLRTLLSASHTMTLRDLEEALFPADRSTIFRTLNLFLDHHLIHAIEDGSGATCYELCMSEGECTLDDQHVHFHCTHCGRTICLHDTPVPQINLPEGYHPHQYNCVVIGLCPACAKKL